MWGNTKSNTVRTLCFTDLGVLSYSAIHKHKLKKTIQVQT